MMTTTPVRPVCRSGVLRLSRCLGHGRFGLMFLAIALALTPLMGDASAQLVAAPRPDSPGKGGEQPRTQPTPGNLAASGSGEGQPPAAQTLSLKEAAALAVANNLATRLAGERRTEAVALAHEARAALLPNLWASASRSSVTENLAAMGFREGMFPGLTTTFLGPFDVFDARLHLVQTIFDLAAVRRWQAGKTGQEIAAWSDELAKQQMVTTSALAYLWLGRSQMAVEAASADLALSRRLHALAADRHDAGAATGLDVTRAETRVAQGEVELAQAINQAEEARLRLLRLTGLPLDRAVVLSDPLRFEESPPPLAAEAVATARQDRVELRLAEAQVRLADYQRRAAKAEFLPKVDFAGDYGSSGAHIDEDDLATRSVGVRLSMPIFNGGMNGARLAESASQQRQAELMLSDVQAQVEEDVRLSLSNLAAAAEQVRASERALALAEKELQQAQDRFSAGVSDNIEVLAAQTALENARDARVAALAAHNAARVNLAAALGHPDKF